MSDTKRAAKDAEEPNIPSQSIPYPTGNPPDPMEEYYKANPERIPPEEAPPPEGETSKARKVRDEPEEDPKKGRK
jgi:hypothetical protein